MHELYFDNNATTCIDPVVANRMHELHCQGIYNPASQHKPGRDALRVLEEAKTLILQSVGIDVAMNSSQVILTSGGTESNNLAITGRLRQCPGTVIVGGTDHPSVIEAGKTSGGSACRVLPVDQNGLIDLNLLEEWLQEIYSRGETVSLVSIMLGNNETGIVQNLTQICRICQQYSVPVHSDIVQVIGKQDVDFQQIGLAAATLTGHKIHGPVGIGALIVAPDFEFQPGIVGGGQQLGLRAGTEPVVPAAGLASSLIEIRRSLHAGTYDELERLRNHFEATLLEQLDDIVIVGADAPRLPHTSNLSFLGIDRQALHMSLDLAGLYCSTGSACSSGSGRPSGSLVAMGMPDSVVQGSLRFSFSKFTLAADIDIGISLICDVVNKNRSSNKTQSLI